MRRYLLPFLIFCVLAVVISSCCEKCNDEPIIDGNSVWLNGGFVAKNQRIILLDTTNFDSKKTDSVNRREAILRIINKYHEAGIQKVQESTEHKCDCDELVLLEGEGLENVDIDTHPDGSDGGNGTGRPPGHADSEFSFGLEKPDVMDGPILTTKSPIKIAILDSGLDSELNSSRRFEPGLNFTSSNRTDMTDPLNHGTNVAKILESTHSSIKIIPLKIFQNEGNLFDALCAMLYAKKLGVSLINCSWGFQGLHNDVFQKVVNSLTDANILIVCSTGNKNKLLSPSAIYATPTLAENSKKISIYPALFSLNNPNVIAVTNDTKGNYSPDYAKILVPHIHKDDTLAVEKYTSYSAALVSKLIANNYLRTGRFWNPAIAERSTNARHAYMVHDSTIVKKSNY